MNNELKMRSKTGKTLEEINIEEVMNGAITGDDIKISKETLIVQSNIAKNEGRMQLGENFERASELVNVPDDELLTIYNMLRPYRSTEIELITKAEELNSKYGALKCSKLILDAVNVYKKRGLLKK